ncbi:MAG TPA: hypothetical protein VG870_15440 [Chitinophagaceae bacterium]|nr:hypothetical protein [Chitinophagaceae bacterium]
MRRLAITIGWALAGLLAGAQDLNGTWRGKLTQGPGGCFPVYYIEMQLKIEGAHVTGSTYHFSDVTNFVKENFEGNFDRGTRALSIAESGVITFHIPEDCIPCIKRYDLVYHRGLDSQTLSGSWGGRMMNSQAACPPGTIVLTRETSSIFNEIRVDTGTIRLDFYDNAEIDGDTISVSLDNQTVVSRQRLALKPITLTLRMDLQKTEHEIIMIAENEGSIPPNTALLIVTAGDKRYRLFLSSDTDQKKVLVRFIYQKPSP